jgi:hypothetical protein
MARFAHKTLRLTVILLFLVYSLLWERVYRTVAYQRKSLLAPPFRL